MNTTIYQERREKLTKSVATGVIILFGNRHQPRNYSANILPFRQDSNVLYYTGIDVPGLILCIDCDSNREILFGSDPDVEDAVWSGEQPQLQELADGAGISKSLSMNEFSAYIVSVNKKAQEIHFLPPYPPDRQILLSELLGVDVSEIKKGASQNLIRSIVNQRSYKSDDEIHEIEWALENITAPMHRMAMMMAVPGIPESQIVAEMQKIAKARNVELAYPAICSIHGEILHNEFHLNTLCRDQLLLVDAGGESPKRYASDITRTTPVSNKFSPIQRSIYELVLLAQEKAIRSIKPGVYFRDIHLYAARIIADGMKELGFMKGNMDDAVNEGAHALFFPHGLGHMMGLDVHDMEDLGENFVGYNSSITRSDQFGTAYLRLARKLESGFVLTVEPGIYFIPALIDLWEGKKLFQDFIDYKKLHNYRDFGGIRIEDNILVSDTGYRVLGPPIPKTCDELEALKS